MRTTIIRLPRHIFVGLLGVLIALILAGGLILIALPRVSPRVFAASLQQVAGTTCAQQPTREHCDTHDPQWQGCATDAQTLGQVAIIEHGFPIGSVERRYSQRCHSWWGRVFDTRTRSQANMSITIAGTTLSASPSFVSDHYRILYSPMVFDATATQPVPAITGTLEIDGITTPPSTTLPAIIPPGN